MCDIPMILQFLRSRICYPDIYVSAEANINLLWLGFLKLSE